MKTHHSPGVPPEASPRANRLAKRLARPLEKFLHVEASSGVILLVCAVIALAWANSPWSASYYDILSTKIVLGLGEFSFDKSVLFWVNDILMVVFFFVVGLEVRREIFEGELSTARRAALPAAAAIGGILVPAAIYIAINIGTGGIDGWGVPMATDIAFAVGVLALLGRRVPAALRVLLLALAIIDDIGAILVIAVFYSSGIEAASFGIAGAAIAGIVGMQRVGIRNPALYILPGIVLWAGILGAGVHPTIAGVILGLLTPVRSWFGQEGFVAEAEAALSKLRAPNTDVDKMLPELDRISMAQREAVPPVTRIEAALHPWVAFAIMPIFALANAGVGLGGLDFGSSDSTLVIVGVCVGLVIGKPLGVVGFSWLAVRLGLATLPRGVTWTGMIVVGFVAGIGFTMALFIGGLAFTDPMLLGTAKLAVLIASLLAGVIGLTIGFRFLAKDTTEGAQTPTDAERSDED